MAREPGEGLSLLKTLSDNPDLESHYKRVVPPEDYENSEDFRSRNNSHGWSVLNYKDIFMAKPTRHTDQVTIATKFGVEDQWKVYADKQTKLESDERDEICDRYYALLYLCTCQGRCDVDLDFIEGRHRLVNVLYFMNAAKYDSALNDIIPSTANVSSMFKYGVGDEVEDRLVDLTEVIQLALSDEKARLVNDVVTIKVLIPKLEQNIDYEELLGLCRTYSKLISDAKHESSNQSLGSQLATIARDLHDKAERAKKKNQVENGNAPNFETMKQPSIPSVQKTCPDSKDPTANPTMLEWDEYADYQKDPFDSTKEEVLYKKLFKVAGAHGPYYPSYPDLAIAPGIGKKDEKLTTTFFVDVMMVLPKVYYIIVAASKGKRVSEIIKNADDHEMNIKFLLKYQFQQRAPDTLVSLNGRKYYNDIKTSLLRNESLPLAATTIIVYMIISSMCFDDGKTIIDQALRRLETRSTGQTIMNTLKNLGENNSYNLHIFCK